MDRGRCLMSTKRQILQSDYFPTPAFQRLAFPRNAAEDSRGFLWPPRSYSCSFCKREFRSAQALGGHMNVHRRDRARLKQQSPNNNSNNNSNETLIHLERELQETQKVVIKKNDIQKGFLKECAMCLEDDEQVRTDLSVGLNSAFCSSKRAKMNNSSSRMLSPLIVSKMINHGDLDLELRLGADPPKVK